MTELCRGRKGPVDRLVDYLHEQGKEIKTVFASYEVEPLMFHLQAAAVRVLPLPGKPDVIVSRAGWECDYYRVLIASNWKPMAELYRVSWQRAASGREMDIHCAYLRRFIQTLGYTHLALPPADH